MAENRDAALEAALKQIEKEFGKGSVMRLGDKVNENVEVTWRFKSSWPHQLDYYFYE